MALPAELMPPANRLFDIAAEASEFARFTAIEVMGSTIVGAVMDDLHASHYRRILIAAQDAASLRIENHTIGISRPPKPPEQTEPIENLAQPGWAGCGPSCYGYEIDDRGVKLDQGTHAYIFGSRKRPKFKNVIRHTVDDLESLLVASSEQDAFSSYGFRFEEWRNQAAHHDLSKPLILAIRQTHKNRAMARRQVLGVR